MIERLRAVISTLETLPPEQQERAAAEFEMWLADQPWDAWLKSTEGEQFLDELAQDYTREQQEGTIKAGGWGE